jgi:hypothetical protein
LKNKRKGEGRTRAREGKRKREIREKGRLDDAVT